MGNNQVKKINFEDVKYAQNKSIIISTLPSNKQDCLIKGTVPLAEEEDLINDILYNDNKKTIIIYGQHANDDSIFTKYKQLIEIGFYNVFIYQGGLFEWLLLQDIYGKENFSTTSNELDILKFRPSRILGKMAICN